MVQPGGEVRPLRRAAVHDGGRGGSSTGAAAAAAPRRARAPRHVLEEDGDSSDGAWEAGREAGAPTLVLHGSLVSRNCGIRLAVGLAPTRADEYYSKAVRSTQGCWLRGLAGWRLLLLGLTAGWLDVRCGAYQPRASASALPARLALHLPLHPSCPHHPPTHPPRSTTR